MQNNVALRVSGHQNRNCFFKSFHRFDVAAFGHHNKQGKVDDTEVESRVWGRCTPEINTDLVGI